MNGAGTKRIPVDVLLTGRLPALADPIVAVRQSPREFVGLPSEGKGHTLESCLTRQFLIPHNVMYTHGRGLGLEFIRSSKRSGAIHHSVVRVRNSTGNVESLHELNVPPASQARATRNEDYGLHIGGGRGGASGSLW
jgi:hypothetical protein